LLLCYRVEKGLWLNGFGGIFHTLPVVSLIAMIIGYVTLPSRSIQVCHVRSCGLIYVGSRGSGTNFIVGRSGFRYRSNIYIIIVLLFDCVTSSGSFKLRMPFLHNV